jgi:hypothetical protein
MGQFGTNGRSILPIGITDASGSFVILQPGIPSSSFNVPASMSIAILKSASFAIEADPDDKSSVQFRIPSRSAGTTNDRIAFYISGSGEIGIGTKDPETSFDVRDAKEDVDPKRRDLKSQIFKVTKDSQKFDTPVTASIISASGNIHAGNKYFLNNVQILNDAFSVFTVGHQDRSMILHGSAVNLGFGAIPVNASGLVSFIGNVQLGNATSDKVSISSSLFAGSHITASGNISSSGTITSNETTTTTLRAANGNGLIHDKKIWITPTDFDSNSTDGVNGGIITDSGGNFADTGRRLTFYAQKYIPTGWKATAVKIEGSSTVDRYTAYSSSFDVGTSAAVCGATAIGTEVSLATAVQGGGGVYLSIEWGSRGSTEVYGGYIQLTES